MSVTCCASEAVVTDQRYRRILLFAMVLNLLMCVIEIVAAWHAKSTSLFADSMDFMADGLNYAVTLFALGLSSHTRARVAMAKGYTMAVYGLFILLLVLLRSGETHPPLASIMGVIGMLALAVNVGVAFLLFHFRVGDSNRQAVWLCTRNDAIANGLVLLAALGVWLNHQRWPDMVAATIIGLLGFWSGNKVIRQARLELKSVSQPAHKTH